MICATCGEQNPDGNKFCTSCGAPMSQQTNEEEAAAPVEDEVAASEAAPTEAAPAEEPTPAANAATVTTRDGKPLVLPIVNGLAIQLLYWKNSVRVRTNYGTDEYLRRSTFLKKATAPEPAR